MKGRELVWVWSAAGPAETVKVNMFKRLTLLINAGAAFMLTTVTVTPDTSQGHELRPVVIYVRKIPCRSQKSKTNILGP